MEYKQKSTKNKISYKKISLPSKFVPNGIDQVGSIVEKSGHVFRFINKDKSDSVLKLFECGLIAELIQNNLFPATKIIQYPDSVKSLVIEHQTINNQTYSQEWSFNMFKDAALCTLKVNLIANKYGYQLIDAHPSNVMFDNNVAKFIDLGSFIDRPNQNNSWFAAEEFLKTFYYPLKLWSDGYNFIANTIITKKVGEINHTEYLLIRYPILRLIPPKILHTFVDGSYFPLSRAGSIPDEYLKIHFSKIKYKLIRFLIDNKLLPFQRFNFKRYLRDIDNLNSSYGGFWNSYQRFELSIKDKSNQRFFKIYERIKKRNITSIVDLASNMGVFSIIGVRNKYIKSSICIDYEDVAIDKLYLFLKKSDYNITPVVQNFIYPLLNKSEKNIEDRFKADAVVALAITHHLTLSQHIPLDLIFERISKFATKYVFVEFMPKGLWNGKNSPPLPNWYTKEWFEKSFKRFFILEEIKEVSENRILYVGKVKS